MLLHATSQLSAALAAAASGARAARTWRGSSRRPPRRCPRPRRRPRWWRRSSSRACAAAGRTPGNVRDLQLPAARQPAATLGRAKSVWHNARGGGVRLSAHQNRSPQLYLQSPKMYFDAHCDHSLPHANVASETTQHTLWTLKAFESHCQARNPRCTCWSGTNGSAATKCSAHPTSAQASWKSPNRCRMGIFSRARGSEGPRDWVSTSSGECDHIGLSS